MRTPRSAKNTTDQWLHLRLFGHRPPLPLNHPRSVRALSRVTQIDSRYSLRGFNGSIPGLVSLILLVAPLDPITRPSIR